MIEFITPILTTIHAFLFLLVTVVKPAPARCRIYDIENRCNVFRPTWENLPWKKTLKWENDRVLPFQLLKLTLKTTIKQDCWLKNKKKQLVYKFKKQIIFWWTLCGYYHVIQIKPTGRNIFLFLWKHCWSLFIKYWNLLWGQEELDFIFVVSSLHTITNTDKNHIDYM